MSNDFFHSHIVYSYDVIGENVYAVMTLMKTRNNVGRGWFSLLFSAGKLFSLFLFPHCRLDMFAKKDRSHSKFPWVFIPWNW
jgi:hypothetical protein